MEDTKTMNPLLRPILTALLLSLSAPVLACSAAGPNTHVGQILSVDGQSHTLTINDMATGQPISFAVNDALMARLAVLKGQVIVRYKDGAGGRLVATDIRQ